MKYLEPFTSAHFQTYQSLRFDLTQDQGAPEDASKNYAQAIEPIADVESLETITAQYILIGIPEDIGVRANMGRPGAQLGWEAFLKSFLALQHSELQSAERFAILGSITTDDLMQQAKGLEAQNHQERQQLSHLVATLDHRVTEVVSAVIAAGKIPVVIGGGHNNAYPLLRAAGHLQAINCINIDAHTDLRAAKGRHSGNGFAKALKDGYLNSYFIMGIQEAYLSQPMIELIEDHENIEYLAYEPHPLQINETVAQILKFIDSRRFGLEVDLDVIANFPSSAQSPVGYDFDSVSKIFSSILQQATAMPKYIHLCEAAPEYGYAGQVGKALASLVNQLP